MNLENPVGNRQRSVKKRLDMLLVEEGFFAVREKAKAAIMAGCVTVDGIMEDKPGTPVTAGSKVALIKDANPYVSRGGLKLEKALKHFEIDLSGLTALDIGASTGGFTDCMLQHRASKVVCVDVGYGQLAWKLRNDPRITVMERTNARYLKPADFTLMFDFSSVDVSFISLSKILPALYSLMKDDASVVCLVKPQFEAGRGSVGKKGVVRDIHVHKSVIADAMTSAAGCGYTPLAVTYSPIRGPEGNVEYLIFLGMPGHMIHAPERAFSPPFSDAAASVVNEAWQYFNIRSSGKITSQSVIIIE